MLTKVAETIEIRWHGRGGQGAVTSAELIALAAVNEGRFAQALPSFGPERRGAPVLAFNRISNIEPIRIRTAVTQPDIVVVLDPSLLYVVDVTAGLKEGGTIVINSQRTLVDIKSEVSGNWRVAVVNTARIAREILGVPIVNTTMLGALIKATEIVKLESVTQPIEEHFGARGRNNIEACHRAYDETLVAEPEIMSRKPKKPAEPEILPLWQELLPGCILTEPGSAKRYRTGDWRSQHPEFDNEKCNKCGLCYLYCPEGCVRQIEDGYFEADLYYCKGCGICTRECPRKAISMLEEIQQ